MSSASEACKAVPIVDVSNLFQDDKALRLKTAEEIGRACKNIGFMVIVGHQVNDETISAAWNSSRQFFDQSLEEKMKFVKPQHEYPFGYSGLGGEVLSAGKAVEGNNSASSSVPAPPDLKEMFSIGPDDPATGFPARIFPKDPSELAEAWTKYYEALSDLGRTILRAFALALDLPDEMFFDSFVNHHASALRAINYPAIERSADHQLLPGQLRASAHTDYGAVTILRADGPGLQVSKDTSPPTWWDVPHVENGFIINLGDLMRRWTNDRWLSTLHRVIIPEAEVSSNEINANGAVTSTKRRQSMAFFYNINRDAVVEVLLQKPGDVALHQPIVAGDFLMQKHLASIDAGVAAANATE